MNHRLEIDPNREWKFQLMWIRQVPVEWGQEINIWHYFQVQRLLLGVAQSFVSEEEKELICWTSEMAPALKARLITKKTRELTYWDQCGAGFGSTCFYVPSDISLVLSLGELHYRWNKEWLAQHLIMYVKARIQIQVSLSPEPIADHTLKRLLLKTGVIVELVEHFLCAVHNAWVDSAAPQEEKTILSGNWVVWEPLESS